MTFAFRKKYDVAVVGAGVAGVAAAVAAARRGRKVALIEKQTLIGGLATSGLIFVYLPLCDGFGHQVISGISEEMLRASAEFGPFELNKKWGGETSFMHRKENRFEVEFSPAGFTLTLDEMLKKAGVDLWLDTLVCTVQKDHDRVIAMEVENISGRGVIEADCFVDASGSAILVRQAGGRVFHDENLHSVWYMETAPNAAAYHLTGSLHIRSFRTEERNFAPEESCDGKANTEYTRLAWEKIRQHYRENYSAHTCTPAENYPVHLPAMSQFRKLAAIAGKATLDSGDNQKRFGDSIGMTGDWRVSGPVWETPFGALVPEKTGGVFAAGRCISSIHDSWEVYRVIPAAAMTGEAAGIAAAIASERNCDTPEVKAADVQNALREKGIRLHLDEIGLSYDDRPDCKGAWRVE